jgi:hypothetical protein
MRPSAMNLCFCAPSRLAYKGLAASTIFSRSAWLCAKRSAFAELRHRRQGTVLLLLQGDRARLLGGLECGTRRDPQAAVGDAERAPFRARPPATGPTLGK